MLASLLSPTQLSDKIKQAGYALGFEHVQITRPDHARSTVLLERFLTSQAVGEMRYLKKHGLKRSVTSAIHPPTLSVICVSLNYLPESIHTARQALNNKQQAVISLYARQQDYHHLLRDKLKQLAEQLRQWSPQPHSRIFVDSAPIGEKMLAEQAGIGFMGKHTNIIDRQRGSFFFLGEIACNLAIAYDHPVTSHCGSCRKCIDICPTQAIIAPYQLEVNRCISYLTIEHQGAIPDELKAKMGNHIFGCDDCQLVCPWNRYAQLSNETPLHNQDALTYPKLLDLLTWDEAQFLHRVHNSPIARTGWLAWQRNIVIALGNAYRDSPADGQQIIIRALQQKQTQWKLDHQHQQSSSTTKKLTAWQGLFDALDWVLLRFARQANIADIATVKAATAPNQETHHDLKQ